MSNGNTETQLPTSIPRPCSQYCCAYYENCSVVGSNETNIVILIFFHKKGCRNRSDYGAMYVYYKSSRWLQMMGSLGWFWRQNIQRTLTTDFYSVSPISTNGLLVTPIYCSKWFNICTNPAQAFMPPFSLSILWALSPSLSRWFFTLRPIITIGSICIREE